MLRSLSVLLRSPGKHSELSLSMPKQVQCKAVEKVPIWSLMACACAFVLVGSSSLSLMRMSLCTCL